MLGLGTTRYEASFAPGTHRVLVEAEGYQPRESEVAIAAGSTRSLDVVLLPVEGGVPAWAWIGGGAAITGGLVVAAYFIFQPADPIQPAGNFNPGNVVVYPNQVKTPFALSF